MESKLLDILNKQRKSLEALLRLLDEQYKYIMKRDVFSMEAIAEQIQYANKNIAEIEVERRRLVPGDLVKECIAESKNDDIKLVYKEIKKLMQALQLQNDTNKTLIRQDLSYTNKMLNLVNPNREAVKYNSYGKTFR